MKLVMVSKLANYGAPPWHMTDMTGWEITEVNLQWKTGGVCEQLCRKHWKNKLLQEKQVGKNIPK